MNKKEKNKVEKDKKNKVEKDNCKQS